MSNVFLSTSLVTLAQRSIGCYDDDTVCDGKVYGFRPSSLLTIIATISGLMAAFLLPFIGAIVDFTKYRRQLGAGVAAFSIAIQAIQIGTVQATWFFMAVLQAINGFNYSALAVAANAYLPEIRREIGEETTSVYSSKYYMFMFGIEALYLIVVVAVSIALFDSDDVLTAQFGQAFDVLVSGSFYALAFYFFTEKEARRTLAEGQSLTIAGIRQVCVTIAGIWKHYPTTLGWFLLGVVFGESGTKLVERFLMKHFDS